jgi:hypothetical protein
VLKHLDIEVFDAVSPFALRITNVAQKAKDVLVEPVLLLIATVNILYIESPVLQVSQVVKGKVAATKLKSFDVHELGAGNVCATAFEKNKTAGKKISSKFLMVAANQALC